MSIFGNSTGHNSSTVDTAITYTYSTILILSVLIALLLNPVVFLYNTAQPTSLVSRLFQLLALTDTLFLIRPVNALYNLLRPGVDPPYVPDPSLGRRIVCLITFVTGFTSMFLTLTLCVVRYIKIRFPFWALSHDPHITWGAVISITVDFIWNLSASVYTNFSQGDHFWESATQSVIVEPSGGSKLAYVRTLLIIGPFFLKIGLSVVFSVLTLFCLRADSGLQVSDMKRKSAVMILLLNLGNVVWCVVSLVVQSITKFQNAPLRPSEESDWRYWYYYFQFIESVLMQSVLVAYNPLVICSRNTGIRKMLKDLVKHGRFVAPDAVVSEGPVESGVEEEGFLETVWHSLSMASSWTRARLFGR